MPQMSPMWWLTLFMMFNLTFFIMNSNLFFIKNYNFKKNIKNNNKIMNWKW